MRHPRRKRRIERVNIKRDVNWPIELQLQIPDQISHLDRLDTKLPHLFTLIRSERSNPNLHEALRKLLFHDPRERGSVRITITLIAVVNIRMRVEMKNVEVFVLARERSHDRRCDRVIAAERDRHQSISDQRVHRALDQRRHLTARDRLNIPRIEEDRIPGKIGPILTSQVPRIGTESRTNLWWRIGRTLRE